MLCHADHFKVRVFRAVGVYGLGFSLDSLDSGFMGFAASRVYFFWYFGFSGFECRVDGWHSGNLPIIKVFRLRIFMVSVV